MKKIITIIVFLLLTLETYADKLEIYNNTNYNLSYNLTTYALNGNPYPYLQTSGASTLVTLNAWGTAIYNNGIYGSFPFYSPGTTPLINTWARTIAAGIPSTNTPSNIAQNLYGTTQALGKFKFVFDGTPFSANIGEPGHADFEYIYDSANTNILIQYFSYNDTTTGETIYYILAD